MATRSEEAVKKFLAEVAHSFARKPFKPIIKGGHLQTLVGYAWPREYRRREPPVDEERLFEVAADTRVLAHCRWQSDRSNHSTVVIWHGMEGSTTSLYMIAMADKAFRVGFNVVRVNYRNCGGTEHLTRTLYHGGMSDDLRAVIQELIAKDGLKKLFAIGFSLGGNMLLKLAGEYGDAPPTELVGICTVSPSVDLLSSTEMLSRKRNWLYQQRFLATMKKRIRIKQQLFPDLYDVAPLSKVDSIRDFDETFTALAHGFANATDYYERASAMKLAAKIRLPTLIIHAQDDPFILFEPIRNRDFKDNPYILVLAPESGGHVGFVSAKATDEDRFWAENRAIEFCQMAEKYL
jgi:predicted alpha/beta-fold hydrolase